MTPRTRARIARWVVAVSLVAWPATQFTVARNEPPFVLALSWLAITLTAADIAFTTDTREKIDEE